MYILILFVIPGVSAHSLLPYGGKDAIIHSTYFDISYLDLYSYVMFVSL